MIRTSNSGRSLSSVRGVRGRRPRASWTSQRARSGSNRSIEASRADGAVGGDGDLVSLALARNSCNVEAMISSSSTTRTRPLVVRLAGRRSSAHRSGLEGSSGIAKGTGMGARLGSPIGGEMDEEGRPPSGARTRKVKVPPISSTIWRLTNRPRPVPLGLGREIGLKQAESRSPEAKSLGRRPRRSGRWHSPSSRPSMWMRPPLPVASMALSTRFRSTWVRWSRTASDGRPGRRGRRW